MLFKSMLVPRLLPLQIFTYYQIVPTPVVFSHLTQAIRYQALCHSFADLMSQYDPASLQYMLDFFRNVAQSIPTETSPNASPDGGVTPIDSLGGGRDDGNKRAGIIVLREDLDFYVIPPRADIEQKEMIEVKRAAARALLKQDGIFSGLKRSDEPGTTEAHLIEMLTAGYVLAKLLHTIGELTCF
jgi:hypothetical protein